MPRRNRLMHVEYVKIYHEALKSPLLIDVPIDSILHEYLYLLASLREEWNFLTAPTHKDILYLTKKLLRRLTEKYDL